MQVVSSMRNIHENLVTNLPENHSLDNLKTFYHLRWNIETSFSHLKHAISATSFHSKKYKYICQEVWARLILYNFCSVISVHVAVEKKADWKHEMQINYTTALKICHTFLRFNKCNGDPPDVESLISCRLQPIRPNRNFPRI